MVTCKTPNTFEVNGTSTRMSKGTPQQAKKSYLFSKSSKSALESVNLGQVVDPLERSQIYSIFNTSVYQNPHGLMRGKSLKQKLRENLKQKFVSFRSVS